MYPNMENNISKVAAALEKLTNATVELKSFGVIRSRKPVSTDYSEWLVRQLFGGSLAPSKNQPGWDIDLGEEKVQVKVSFNPDSTANRWSYIKDPSFYDSLILIVLSDDYKVQNSTKYHLRKLLL